jgi:hypothetical protein
VEIRWDSASGPLLGTATGPDFSKSVTLPKDSRGPHLVQAVAHSRSGETFIARASVAITDPRNSGGGSGGSGGDKPPGAGANRDTGQIGRPIGRRRGSRGRAHGRGAGGLGRRADAQGHPAGAERSGSRGESAARPGVVNRGGRDFFAGSVPPAEARSTDSRPASANGSGQPPVGARPSERSATGDLWSGFGPGKRASLIPSATDPVAPSDGPGGQLAIGVALLGLGLVALLGGFGVAEVRRRRALARPGR